MPSGTSIHGRVAEEGICIIPTKEKLSLPKAYHLSRNFESALPPPPQGALQHGVPLLPPLVRIVPPDRVRVLLLQLERDPGIVHLWQQFKSAVRKIEEL